MMGHSMGSFLTRAYCAQFGSELAGAIVLGTAAPNMALMKAEKVYANSLVKKRGEKGHDAVFDNLSVKTFNKSFNPNRTVSDWLSRDEKEVDLYVADPLCGFELTTSGYRDILDMEIQINTGEWYRKVPDIPILIMSGDKDPVGEFGKGPKKVAKGLARTGHNVRLILYPEARHVLLCETNKDEVYGDIFNFLSSVIQPAG
jgi:alpha-beta hydrolase superfamily lysophospholipase